jgi:hypothetical protein
VAVVEVLQDAENAVVSLGDGWFRRTGAGAFQPMKRGAGVVAVALVRGPERTRPPDKSRQG